jgi:hypothetical protein
VIQGLAVQVGLVNCIVVRDVDLADAAASEDAARRAAETTRADQQHALAREVRAVGERDGHQKYSSRLK